ncbi:cytidylyltransferase domain-containing protein [Enterococcus sp. BWR-S5]|uniref:cytidylyltransferase domain-containing protein n=1 Tax=Enterococcus sp. BWR-S5 TaxID=2787714 RepID=UPI001922F312|nr:NTP transferase domain-containing protein [Enterococcus sp. BWR-S5]MBL1224739.1 hypothetical protein [Enterococcus sp. BWR-S5]
MNVHAFIQARSTSTRLAGKVTMTIAGKTIIEHIYEKLNSMDVIDQVVVVTPANESNAGLINFLSKKELFVFCGDEQNVLSRYIEAGKFYQSDIIIRATGDNPLIEESLINKLIQSHIENKNDYTYCSDAPLGTSIEVVNWATLARLSEMEITEAHKEHVTLFIKDNPEQFKIGKLSAETKLTHSNVRLTVDTKEDFELMEQLGKEFPAFPYLSFQELERFYEEQPELFKINSHIIQR